MSGNEGGKYHEVAKALSKILFQKGLKIEVKTSSGSRENSTALTNGISDLALLQNDISNSETFQQATKNAKGAIIGSAFVKHLSENGLEKIDDFISSIKKQKKGSFKK